MTKEQSTSGSPKKRPTIKLERELTGSVVITESEMGEETSRLLNL